MLPSGLFGVDWRMYGFYKGYYQSFRSTLFNPENRSVDFLGYRKGPDYSLSQYFSLQTEFLSLQWQVDMMGTAEYTNDWNGDLGVKQLFFQKDLFKNGILMAGRSIQRWGTGYAFNPTDVVAPQKELSDPDNSEKRAAGSDMVKIEYFGETYSIAACYLTKVETGSRIRMEGSKLAFRFYKNLWDVDVSLITLFNRDETPILGVNFATVLGERLEIHGEVSAQRGSYWMVHRAVSEPYTLYEENPLTDFRKNDNRLYKQVLLGFQVTFPKNILWVCEYFHRDQGYSREEWKWIISYVRFLNAQLESLYEEVAFGNLIWSLNVFSPKGAMRDYMMHYISIPIFKDVELRCTGLMNLSDFSRVLIPELNVGVGNRFTFYARSFIFQGTEEAEFGALFQSYALEGGVRF